MDRQAHGRKPPAPPSSLLLPAIRADFALALAIRALIFATTKHTDRAFPVAARTLYSSLLAVVTKCRHLHLLLQ